MSIVGCIEHQRLVAEHLKAIGNWKVFFNKESALAVATWKKALKAEMAIVKHDRSHGCSGGLEEVSEAPRMTGNSSRQSGGQPK